MPGQFLHGVEVINIDNGTRPVQTVKSSVIGVVLTTKAEQADLPLTLVTTDAEIEALATQCDINPLRLIRKQTGAMMVVTSTALEADAITAIQSMVNAESVLNVEPRILIAPDWSSTLAVATEMVAIADRLKAMAVIDCPANADKVAAVTYKENFGDKRVIVCYPEVKIYDVETSTEIAVPMSSLVAGLIAKRDNENGFWWSPSNQTINGIIGLATPIDFKLGDTNCTANYLNENEIVTIIRKDGFRLWGNRTTSADPKWAFINVVRTADMINDSLQRAHLWAVDRNITRTYLDDVKDSVNAYLRDLTARGAILGGECWADEALNTPEQLQAGKVTFDFDFTPPAPAERITFRSQLVNTYFEEIINA